MPYLRNRVKPEIEIIWKNVDSIYIDDAFLINEISFNSYIINSGSNRLLVLNGSYNDGRELIKLIRGNYKYVLIGGQSPYSWGALKFLEGQDVQVIASRRKIKEMISFTKAERIDWIDVNDEEEINLGGDKITIKVSGEIICSIFKSYIFSPYIGSTIMPLSLSIYDQQYSVNEIEKGLRKFFSINLNNKRFDLFNLLRRIEFNNVIAIFPFHGPTITSVKSFLKLLTDLVKVKEKVVVTYPPFYDVSNIIVGELLKVIRGSGLKVSQISSLNVVDFLAEAVDSSGIIYIISYIPYLSSISNTLITASKRYSIDENKVIAKIHLIVDSYKVEDEGVKIYGIPNQRDLEAIKDLGRNLVRALSSS
jgi:flavorubredoxin